MSRRFILAKASILMINVRVVKQPSLTRAPNGTRVVSVAYVLTVSSFFQLLFFPHAVKNV
jgi:hypothetical protein